MPPCFVTASRWVLALAAVLMPALAPAQAPLHQRIDQAVRAGLDGYETKAARVTDDAEFCRRVFLDLTGIIPSVKETRAFLADQNSDRRARLVDRLLASDAYARHMQHTFDALLMDRRPEKHVKRAEWQEFLRAAFADNTPYDALVRQMLSADGTDPKTRVAARFFLDRDGEPHQLTRDISRVFLGMNLHCAQCHDHPLVEPYKQEHYFGIYAFLSRSYLYADKATKLVIYAEKGEGDVGFESVFVKGKKTTVPRVPGGPEPKEEPAFAKGEEYISAVKKDERGIPKYSRRAQLTGAVTESRQFTRATANRVWSLFLGRGIVHPVEYDHADNPPSHPALLDLLTSELAEQKHDLKALIRAIVLSETYQRSSELPKDGKDVDAKWFAVAELRPLAPEPFAWSLLQATGQLDAERLALGEKATEASITTKLTAQAATVVNLFAPTAGEPAPPDFSTTIDQTLFLNNSKVVRDWLTSRAGTLLDRLGKLPEAEPLADELYLSVLSRLPSADEKRDVADYLARRGSERTAALQELAWALLTSAEFRFNH